jgi:hypothetical protein
MGGSPDVPAPSAEEKALQKEQAQQLKIQTQILQEQQDLNKLLLAPTLKASGLQATYGDDGEIIGVDEIPDPLKERRQSLEEAFINRTEQALRGELPDNPALISDLREQEQNLRESLRKRLGTDYETSTAGIQALDQFNETRQGILEGTRRGDLSQAEGLSLARENAIFQRQQQGFQNLASLRQADIPLAAAFGNNARGFGAAQIPYQNQRNMQFQAAQQGGGFGDIFGSILGYGVGAFAGGAGSSFGSSLFSKPV